MKRTTIAKNQTIACGWFTILVPGGHFIMIVITIRTYRDKKCSVMFNVSCKNHELNMLDTRTHKGIQYFLYCWVGSSNSILQATKDTSCRLCVFMCLCLCALPPGWSVFAKTSRSRTSLKFPATVHIAQMALLESPYAQVSGIWLLLNAFTLQMHESIQDLNGYGSFGIQKDRRAHRRDLKSNCM